MSTITDVGAGLNAAFRLAWGRGDGMRLLAASNDYLIAARSFWALPLCLPSFVCLHLLDWAQLGTPVRPLQHFALDLMCLAVYWVAFAVITHALAGRINRAARWPRYIALWNWCNLVQYVMQTVAALPLLAGLPDWVSQTCWLVAIGWSLWLEWTAARLSLEVGPLMAAAFTGFDFVFGLYLFGLTDAMSGAMR